MGTSSNLKNTTARILRWSPRMRVGLNRKCCANGQISQTGEDEEDVALEEMMTLS